MLAIYSLILSLGFVLMLPLFLLAREKYAVGFRQRFGDYPGFTHDGRGVIWLHCVSVGETNAARPLVDELLKAFPDRRLVVSTTTKTGQRLAREAFGEKADAVVYFPFDWKFSVRKALGVFRPSLILLMETEIWPRFIRESKAAGARVALVNGRLSQKSADRYRMVDPLLRRVLANIDLALMQSDGDAERIISLGMVRERVRVTGNLKFDHTADEYDENITAYIRDRFAIGAGRPLVVAASTHRPEERWIAQSLKNIGHDVRLLIAPRHPERFDEVSELLNKMGLTHVRRSAAHSADDQAARIILLDSIGELRAIYPLAEIVFVGGSLIEHGGQSILEPAAAGKAIVTGPHTRNFDAAVKELTARDALIRTPVVSNDGENVDRLREAFAALLDDSELRRRLGENARSAVEANRGATIRSIRELLILKEAEERTNQAGR